MILFALVIFTSMSLIAQSTVQLLSNAEIFSAKPGALISKDIIKVGNAKTTAIDVVHYTDLFTKETMSAVMFKIASVGKYSIETITVNVDSDEIEGLLKSLLIIKDDLFTKTPENYKEVTFKSRSGFEAGCYFEKGVWVLYIKLNIYDSKSLKTLETSDLPLLIEQLEKAKNIL